MQGDLEPKVEKLKDKVNYVKKKIQAYQSHYRHEFNELGNVRSEVITHINQQNSKLAQERAHMKNVSNHFQNEQDRIDKLLQA